MSDPIYNRITLQYVAQEDRKSIRRIQRHNNGVQRQLNFQLSLLESESAGSAETVNSDNKMVHLSTFPIRPLPIVGQRPVKDRLDEAGKLHGIEPSTKTLKEVVTNYTKNANEVLAITAQILIASNNASSSDSIVDDADGSGNKSPSPSSSLVVETSTSQNSPYLKLEELATQDDADVINKIGYNEWVYHKMISNSRSIGIIEQQRGKYWWAEQHNRTAEQYEEDKRHYEEEHRKSQEQVLVREEDQRTGDSNNSSESKHKESSDSRHYRMDSYKVHPTTELFKYSAEYIQVPKVYIDPQQPNYIMVRRADIHEESPATDHSLKVAPNNNKRTRIMYEAISEDMEFGTVGDEYTFSSGKLSDSGAPQAAIQIPVPNEKESETVNEKIQDSSVCTTTSMKTAESRKYSISLKTANSGSISMDHNQIDAVSQALGSMDLKSDPSVYPESLNSANSEPGPGKHPESLYVANSESDSEYQESSNPVNLTRRISSNPPPGLLENLWDQSYQISREESQIVHNSKPNRQESPVEPGNQNQIPVNPTSTQSEYQTDGPNDTSDNIEAPWSLEELGRLRSKQDLTETEFKRLCWLTSKLV